MNVIDFKIYDKYKMELILELKNRIVELNSIIENLDVLNKELYEENKKLKDLLKFSICKYPPYMIVDIIKKENKININSSKITKIAEENKLFDSEFLALKIPRKRNSNEKFASAVIFSILGVVKIFDIIENSSSKEYDFDSKNDLDISISQLEKGDIVKYSIKELRDMENE